VTGEPFKEFAPNLISPLEEIVAVANPGDFGAAILNSAGVQVWSRAVYVGVTGNLAVKTLKGTTVTLVGLAAGVWHAMRIEQVIATGTTADEILIGY
jgi:hypothetical protein